MHASRCQAELHAAERGDLMPDRPTHTERDVTAGCRTCQDRWAGKNAQAVAARHYDATGHETWVEVVMLIRYGGQRKTPSSQMLLTWDPCS